LIVPSEQLLPLIAKILASGSNVKLTVTGNSMRPFIRDNATVLLASAAQRSLLPGDVVLAQRPDDVLVLHRILRKNREGYFLAGDAQGIIEGPVSHDRIFAHAYAVVHDSKEVRLDRVLMRKAGILWIRTAPLARILTRLIRPFMQPR
jgi:signal peptidase I